MLGFQPEEKNPPPLITAGENLIYLSLLRRNAKHFKQIVGQEEFGVLPFINGRFHTISDQISTYFDHFRLQM
jgi:hypothetical protein